MPSTLDNPALLELMIADASAVADIYKPTNYWDVYHREIIPELREQGLHDFRRRRKTMLHKFNARDIVTDDLGNLESLLTEVESRARKAGARPLDSFEISLVGNPEHVFDWKGKKYTANMLNYYLDYAYCTRFVDWNRIQYVVELGSGMGKQVEVLKKLYPHLTFILFDVAPQLYVCQQYLSAVFPGSTVSYEVTRQWQSLPATTGQIFFFGNWKFSILDSIPVDLFWSCATFQEMEPAVVGHYLATVNRCAHFVYLAQELEGKKIAPMPGQRGVMEPTTYDHYRQGLTNFEMVELSPKWSFEPTTLFSSFWRNNN